MAKTKGGTSAAKISQKSVLSGATSAAIVAGGLVGATLVAKPLNKILKVDESSSKMKKALPGLLMTALGVIGAIKVKDPKAKLALGGIAAGGMVSAARAAMPGASFLSGALGDASDGANDAWRDTANGMLALPGGSIGYLPAATVDGYGTPTGMNDYNQFAIGAAEDEGVPM